MSPTPLSSPNGPPSPSDRYDSDQTRPEVDRSASTSCMISDDDGLKAIDPAGLDNSRCSIESSTPQMFPENGLTNDKDIVAVKRPIYTLDNFDVEYGYARSKESLGRKMAKKASKQCACSRSRLWSMLVSFFPFLSWMREYKWKTDPVNDLMAGLTVGIMSIPQGMSYAGLVGVPPQYGLYTNLIPTIVYFFVGTSRHAAIGTVAVVSLMMGTIRLKMIPDKREWLAPGCYQFINESRNGSMPFDPTFDTRAFGSPDCYTAPELAMATSMLSGLILALMGLLRLGFVSAYLSDYLVGGFTSGAAIFVLTSQLEYLFGVHLNSFSGPGKIFFTYSDLFKRVNEVNVATPIIALVCVVCLLIVKEWLSPMFQKRFHVPIPAELLAVVIGTIASYFGHFHQRYNVNIVSNIPSGFPTPVLPRFDIMKSVFVDAMVLAIVNYSLSVSLAKVYAQRNNYKINPYQEFFAYSLINLFGSTFQSFPSGVSVARSIVYESAGAKSQFAGIIGTGCVVVCILWLAPFLSALPQSVLGAIIVVACVEMLQQLKQLKPLWKASKIDFSIYVVTFASVVVLDVTLGLAVSVLYAFLTVIIRTQCPRIRTMGRLGDTDVYDELDKYGKAAQTPGMKVFRFQAPLYYANVENFRSKLYKLCGIDPALVKSQQMKKPVSRGSDQSLEEGAEEKRDTANSAKKAPIEDSNGLQFVVIDCSGFSYVDLMGVNVLAEVYQLLNAAGIVVFYAGCNGSVRKIMESANFYSKVPKSHLFVSVHDAVTSATIVREEARKILELGQYSKEPVVAPEPIAS